MRDPKLLILLVLCSTGERRRSSNIWHIAQLVQHVFHEQEYTGRVFFQEIGWHDTFHGHISWQWLLSPLDSSVIRITVIAYLRLLEARLEHVNTKSKKSCNWRKLSASFPSPIENFLIRNFTPSNKAWYLVLFSHLCIEGPSYAWWTWWIILYNPAPHLPCIYQNIKDIQTTPWILSTKNMTMSWISMVNCG